MTYMPGPVHGAVVVTFREQVGSWRYAQTATANMLYRGCSSGGYSSGGYSSVQPDHRILPFRRYRDKNGNDVDTAHKGLPHTRFYLEVEYDHRNIVQLRQHGVELMGSTPYARLFLRVTTSKSNNDDPSSSYEAAIVLWGKSDANDTISVLDAVSFGTLDLSERSRRLYSEIRQDSLPAVETSRWRRPGNAWHMPVVLTSPTPQEWLQHVPFTGLLYKVSGTISANGADEYLLSTLAPGMVSDCLSIS
jgi:hypothetical protein